MERHHRTIHELGMTIFFHNGVPKCFWVEAFSTAIILINCLPITTLDLQSHFLILYGTFPDYHSLCAFGSKRYSYTWDTKHDKFDPKTLSCIFLGYSDQHHGYKCYHPRTCCTYISHHVVFYELNFPYKHFENLHLPLSFDLTLSIFDHWITPPSTLPFPTHSSPPMELNIPLPVIPLPTTSHTLDPIPHPLLP